MAKQQKLICEECKVAFTFDPDEDAQVITSLTDSKSVKKAKSKNKIDVAVIAYLECPNGHTKSYKVIKSY